MAFLLGRGSTSFSSRRAATSSDRAGQSSTLLFDARQSNGLDDEDEDDEDAELNAAFGGADDDFDGNRSQGHSLAAQHRVASAEEDPDTSMRDEEAQLLDPRAQDISHRPLLPNDGHRSDIQLNLPSSASSPPSGGYDFERDPYERGATIVRLSPSGRTSPFSALSRNVSTSSLSLPLAAQAHQPSSGNRRSGRQRARQPASAGLLGAIRNLLPARLRPYGLIGGSASSSRGRRRDGNADADDGDELDDWDAPPPTLPGTYGGGSLNDGVFSNLMAKPISSRLGPNGEPIDIVGGDDELREKEIPPAYEMAVLDAAPPYFDTTVHAPGLGGFAGAGGTGLDDVLIEGLPLGNIFSFFWSLLVSMSFQFVGFLLTTLLSTSHAAKNGSRAGLGITLIQYGLFLQSHEDDSLPTDFVIGGGAVNASDGSAAGAKAGWESFWGGDQGAPPAASAAAVPSRAAPTMIDLFGNSGSTPASNSTGPILLDGPASMSGVANSWLAMVLMIVGWFLLVSSTVQYIQAMRYARALRDGGSSPADGSTGGLFAIISRFTGAEVRPEERTWGLPSRPAPVQTEAPPLPLHNERPSTGSSLFRPLSAWPSTAGIPTTGSFSIGGRSV